MKKILLSSLFAAAPLAFAASDNLARNKENVIAFYELAFNQHKLDEAVEKYVAEPYIQHNLGVADGGKAFIDSFGPSSSKTRNRTPTSSASWRRAIWSSSTSTARTPRRNAAKR